MGRAVNVLSGPSSSEAGFITRQEFLVEDQSTNEIIWPAGAKMLDLEWRAARLLVTWWIPAWAAWAAGAKPSDMDPT